MQCVPSPDNPQGLCLPCSHAQGLARLPCLRYRITDVSLLPKTEDPYYSKTRRFWGAKGVEIGEIGGWASLETKTIEITQDMGGISYSVLVRSFIPIKGDSLSWTWMTAGTKRSYICFPYAIVDVAKTAGDLLRAVDESIPAVVESEIDDTDKLLWDTYAMAFRYSKFTQVRGGIASCFCLYLSSC
jgi:hypothetical protein